MLTEPARLGCALIAAVAAPLGLMLWLREPPVQAAPTAAGSTTTTPSAPTERMLWLRDAPSVQAAPAAAGSPPPRPATPLAGPGSLLAPPTTAVPCVTFSDTYTATEDTELVSDGEAMVVCWKSGACHDGSSPAQRLDPPPASPVARVEPTQICTATRCDPIGPRARAAVAHADADDLHATADHGMLVIGDGEHAQVWARTADRKLALPAAHHGGYTNEDEVVAIDVLGDHVLVSRRWNPQGDPPPPWTPARGAILDVHGIVTGRIATSATRRIAGTSILDLGDGELVVFDGGGAFSLVVHGKPRAFGDLTEWHAVPSAGLPAGDPVLSSFKYQEIPLQAVALKPDPGGETTEIDGTPSGRYHTKTFGYKWCTAGSDAGCHVGEIEIGFQVGPGGEQSQWLRQTSDRMLPSC
ncbi:MAG TPA: hypothetical protein VH165_01380 [Kofleriaceae bacterium]|nr:hypothetical protein [Kofleriaceae bacterium]